jgi:hypothetical protein
VGGDTQNLFLYNPGAGKFDPVELNIGYIKQFEKVIGMLLLGNCLEQLRRMQNFWCKQLGQDPLENDNWCECFYCFDHITGIFIFSS